jgi:hypothetical protein
MANRAFMRLVNEVLPRPIKVLFTSRRISKVNAGFIVLLKPAFIRAS